MQPIGMIDGQASSAPVTIARIAEGDEKAFAEEMAREDEPAGEDAEGIAGVMPLPVPIAERPDLTPPDILKSAKICTATGKAELSLKQMPESMEAPNETPKFDADPATEVAVTIGQSDDEAGQVTKAMPPSAAQRMIEAQMENTGADLTQDIVVPSPGEAQISLSDGSGDQSGGERMANETPSPPLVDNIDESNVERSHSFHVHMAADNLGSSKSTKVAPGAPETIVPVAEQILSNTDNSIDIALTPDDLGHLRLTMTEDNGRLLVTMAADLPDTLDLMRRSADSLGQELRAAGYTSVEFSFTGQGEQRRDKPERPPLDSLTITDAPPLAPTTDYRPKSAMVTGGIDLLL